MAKIIYYSIFLLFFFINTFAMSNIVLPLIYTIPRLKKEKARGNLKKKIPIYFIIGAPITWTIILLGIYFVVYNYFSQYFSALWISSIIAIFALLFFSKKKDMNDDFNQTYKEYLKE